MRTAILLLVTVSLVGSLVCFFVLSDPEPEKPSEDPVDLIGKTTKKPGTGSSGGGLKPPPLPGMGGASLPGIDTRKAEEVFAEFAQEMDFSDEEIAKALELSSLENTRKAQEKGSDKFQKKFKGDFVFARKGVVGEGKEQFDSEATAYFRKLRQQYGFDFYAEE